MKHLVALLEERFRALVAILGSQLVHVSAKNFRVFSAGVPNRVIKIIFFVHLGKMRQLCLFKGQFSFGSILMPSFELAFKVY